MHGRGFDIWGVLFMNGSSCNIDNSLSSRTLACSHVCVHDSGIQHEPFSIPNKHAGYVCMHDTLKSKPLTGVSIFTLRACHGFPCNVHLFRQVGQYADEPLFKIPMYLRRWRVLASAEDTSMSNTQSHWKNHALCWFFPYKKTDKKLWYASLDSIVNHTIPFE